MDSLSALLNGLKSNVLNWILARLDRIIELIRGLVVRVAGQFFPELAAQENARAIDMNSRFLPFAAAQKEMYQGRIAVLAEELGLTPEQVSGVLPMVEAGRVPAWAASPETAGKLPVLVRHLQGLQFWSDRYDQTEEELLEPVQRVIGNPERNENYEMEISSYTTAAMRKLIDPASRDVVSILDRVQDYWSQFRDWAAQPLEAIVAGIGKKLSELKLARNREKRVNDLSTRYRELVDLVLKAEDDLIRAPDERSKRFATRVLNRAHSELAATENQLRAVFREQAEEEHQAAVNAERERSGEAYRQERKKLTEEFAASAETVEDPSKLPFLEWVNRKIVAGTTRGQLLYDPAYPEGKRITARAALEEQYLTWILANPDKKDVDLLEFVLKYKSPESTPFALYLTKEEAINYRGKDIQEQIDKLDAERAAKEETWAREDAEKQQAEEDARNIADFTTAIIEQGRMSPAEQPFAVRLEVDRTNRREAAVNAAVAQAFQAVIDQYSAAALKQLTPETVDVTYPPEDESHIYLHIMSNGKEQIFRLDNQGGGLSADIEDGFLTRVRTTAPAASDIPRK
jgi:hypothetical protein